MKATESSEYMSFQFLQLLREKNPAWRLLTAKQAPFIAAFLYQEFIAENKRQIAEHELIGSLESYLNELNQGQDEDLFLRSGHEYLDIWTDDAHGWLRKFYPTGQDEPYFDITSQAQKAIEWLLSLKQQTFIGTESRLITVFELLHQIVERSETNPELRLAELERRKAEIEQEITRVKNGQVNLLDDTQIIQAGGGHPDRRHAKPAHAGTGRRKTDGRCCGSDALSENGDGELRRACGKDPKPGSSAGRGQYAQADRRSATDGHRSPPCV
ncbi:DUF3375 family protein [Caproicibacter sp.]|uniref:DUF3375 family protein n=1 Tax=Caproicibacter sp. TaxID=2814884 RepID=UPI00398997CB